MPRTMLSELRANPRLRWGVWAIVGILWLYGVLELRDASRLKQEQYAGTLQAITRARAQSVQQEWLERVDPAKLMAVQLESRLWKATTPGLAQAAFQDWLNQALAQAVIARPAVTMTVVDEKGGESASAEGAATVPDDVWKIRAKVDFEFNPQSFLALMSRMAAYDRQVVFESLVIRKEPFPRVEVVMAAYFIKQPVAKAMINSDPIALRVPVYGRQVRQAAAAATGSRLAIHLQ